MDRAAQIKRECDNLAQMLIDKNARYGDSALSPVRVFSRASAEEQILVRIDDKLSRLARGKGAEDEDVILDLLGYLILLRISGTARPPEIDVNITPCKVPPRPWREVFAEDLGLPSDAPFKTISERIRQVTSSLTNLARLCDALLADLEHLRARAEKAEAEVEWVAGERDAALARIEEHRAADVAGGEYLDMVCTERDALRTHVTELEQEVQEAHHLTDEVNAMAGKWCDKYRAAERAFGWVALKDIQPGTLFAAPAPESGLGLRYPDGRFSWLSSGLLELSVFTWPRPFAARDDKTLVYLAGLDGAGCDRITKAYRSFGEDKGDAEG